jgi:hypothetical protein
MIDPRGTRQITYVDVIDSNNINGSEISYAASNTYRSNLTNWITSVTAPSSSVTSQQTAGPGMRASIEYGCKDSKALNYQSFVAHDISLCRYPTQIAHEASSTVDILKVSKDLMLGTSGPEVSILQLFLINYSQGREVSSLKSHGVTDYFGRLTKSALMSWQKTNGIKPATGNFGPKTRTKIQNMFLR